MVRWKRWSAIEDDILRELYPDLGARGVCLCLGRSNNATQKRAGKLGVALRKPTPDQLRELVGRGNRPYRELARAWGGRWSPGTLRNWASLLRRGKKGIPS